MKYLKYYCVFGNISFEVIILDIGNRIKKRRKELKLTQAELANLIGRSTRTIQEYEANNVVPPFNIIQDIGEALKEHPFYLMYGEDNPLKDFGLLKEIMDSNTKFKEQIIDQMQNVLNSFDRLNIKYEVTSSTEHDKIPTEYKISLNDTSFTLDIDDLIDIYDKAQNNFDSSVMTIISTISTYKKQGD